MSGEIGVAQAHELGRAFANPRCGTQLVEVAEVMVDNATKLSHHEFRITVRRWELLADLDGAHSTAEAAHEGRRAGIAEVGEEIHLHARGGLAQGAVMTEIFERFCDAEFTADWDTSARPLRRRGLLRADAPLAIRSAGSMRCMRSSNAPPPLIRTPRVRSRSSTSSSTSPPSRPTSHGSGDIRGAGRSAAAALRNSRQGSRSHPAMWWRR